MKYGKIKKNDPEPTRPKSPYDLVGIRVGALVAMARPYEFADVKLVLTPVKVATGCPHCGHAIEVDISTTPMVNGCYDAACNECKEGVVVTHRFENPFIDPISSNLVPNLFEKVKIAKLTTSKQDRGVVPEDEVDPSPDLLSEPEDGMRKPSDKLVQFDDEDVQDIMDILKGDK